MLGEQPRDIAIADLDGDGDLDFAVVDFPGGITTAFHQRGDFEAGATYPVAGRPVRLVAGDVDGNGSPDLVACLLDTSTSEFTPMVAVLRNQGRGVFAAPVEYATGAENPSAVNATSVALADLDGDGDRDLAVANLNWPLLNGDVLNNTTVALLLNQGDGTFGAPSETPLGPPDTSPGFDIEPSFVVADDLDGDGDADLAVTVGDQDSVYVLENLGAGAFSVSTPYSVDSQPGAFVAADLDGDGDRDLAVTKFETDEFAVLLNQGSGTFAPASSYAGQYYTSSLSCADLDGDGDRDLAFATTLTSLYVVLNQGNGAFDPPLELVGHLRPYSLASGDLDGNGTIDLTSVNGDTVSFFQNLGNGAFETAPRYAAGPSPRLLTNADVDGDGDRDLVVGSGPQTLLAKVSVLGNLGSGAFAPHVEYPVGSVPEALTLADLDRDGLVDMVAAGGFRAYVRRNQGDGTFGSVAEFGIARPNAVTSADLDGDGDLDLAMSLASANTLGVLPGLGNGSLGQVVNYPSAFSAEDITGADFDRDGDVDLALASNDSATARLFDNQGTGTFALLPAYPAGGNPLKITSADFDRDGRIDLAVLLEDPGLHHSPHVGVLRNLGSGSFGPSTLYPVLGQEPLGFLQADVDRDANPDLVVVATQSSALSLFMNLGDGTLANHVQVTARGSGMTCADMDGDGDMDLASTGPAENVEIHFNSCRLGNGF